MSSPVSEMPMISPSPRKSNSDSDLAYSTPEIMLAFELCIVRTGPISTLRTRKSVAREEIRDVLADFTLHRYLSQ